MTFERRNSPNGRVISLNSVAFGVDYLKVGDDTTTLSADEMYKGQRIYFLAIYHLWRFGHGDHPQRER